MLTPSPQQQQYLVNKAQAKAKAPHWLTSDAPWRLDRFQQQAMPLLEEATLGAFRENAATQAGVFQDTLRQMGDQFAFQGINPAAVVGRFNPAMSMGFASQLGGARGGAEAQFAQGQIDLSGQVVSALNQIEAYYDSLSVQKYAADTARRASKKSGQLGMIGALGGGIASGLGSFYGGLGSGGFFNASSGG